MIGHPQTCPVVVASPSPSPSLEAWTEPWPEQWWTLMSTHTGVPLPLRKRTDTAPIEADICASVRIQWDLVRTLPLMVAPVERIKAEMPSWGSDPSTLGVKPRPATDLFSPKPSQKKEL